MAGGDVHEAAHPRCPLDDERCCERVAPMRPEQGTMQSRAMAMAALLELLGDQPVIICNGIPSREAYQIADRPTHFYMIGSMGVASAIGLGGALAKPKKKAGIFVGELGEDEEASRDIRWGWERVDGNGPLGHGWRPQAEELHSCGVRQRGLR